MNCDIQPRFSNDPVFKFKAWVFPTITAQMPCHPLSDQVVDKYKNLALADPSFAVPNKVDLLLGADLFARILNGKRVLVGDAYPVAFGSVFDWIIIGSVPQSNSSLFNSHPISLVSSIEWLMDRFWRVEEPETPPNDFTCDGKCEEIFREKCTRDESGRFTVPKSGNGRHVFRLARRCAESFRRPRKKANGRRPSPSGILSIHG